MRFQQYNPTLKRLAVGVLTVVITAMPLAARTVQAAPPRASGEYLTAIQNAASTFTRNFNPFAAVARRDFTDGAIYEPLMVMTTAGGGHTYPWLATKYAWANHNKTVIVTLRKGVRWSDGKPFTAKDVAFTFNYGKRYAAADETGLMQSGQISSVKALNTYQVAFHLGAVNTTILPTLLSTNVMIVPQHIWSKIHNPATYANAHPVGTGPFTQVTAFSSQEYTLGKNPYYWQNVGYAGIKVPALPSNDAIIAALVSHHLDWVGVSISNIQSTFLNRDPAHNHAFTDKIQPLALEFNDQKYPFSLPVLRKALSLAINRQQIYKIAESGNEPPADALGMKLLFPKWVNPAVQKQATALAKYDPSKAESMLKAAGFTYNGSQLVDPKGNPVSFTLQVPADWNDWDTAMQILVNNFKAIGVDASFQGMDDNSFFDQRSKRLLNPAYFQAGPGPDPYDFFYYYMSKQTYFPAGTAAPGGSGNLEGWYSAKATSLLNQYRKTASSKLKHKIIVQLEKIQVSQLPIIPTVYQAAWFENVTSKFTGFPTKKDNYAIGSPYQYPDDLKILTNLKPVK
ncbi:MAG TPA: ABC transporter substrate-binding protein [Chloroflexota bacterium]|nr:ABC transporter substrate-binding protein [Chloroflexota bacterium]